MAIQFSAEILDRFIAPGISSFLRADIPDLRAEHEQHPYWLANHFLESILVATYKGPDRQYIFNAIYRTQSAFAAYHEARELTYNYLDVTSQYNPAIGKYFQALARWESSFLNWQHLVEIYYRMTGTKVFAKGDGSVHERAYSLCNAAKHAGTAIKGGQHGTDLTVPMWLSNDGFNSHFSVVTYSEYAELMLEAGQFADEIQAPPPMASHV